MQAYIREQDRIAEDARLAALLASPGSSIPVRRQKREPREGKGPKGPSMMLRSRKAHGLPKQPIGGFLPLILSLKKLPGFGLTEPPKMRKVKRLQRQGGR